MSEHIATEGVPCGIHIVRFKWMHGSHFYLNPLTESTRGAVKRFVCMHKAIWGDLAGRIESFLDDKISSGIEFLSGIIRSLEDSSSRSIWIRSIQFIICLRSEFKKMNKVLNDTTKIHLTIFGCMMGKADEDFLHVHYDFRGACKILEILHMLGVPKYGYSELIDLEDASVLSKMYLGEKVPQSVRFVQTN